MSASVARLARWLGPWSGPRNVPSEVLREELAMGSARGGGTSLDAFVYRPRARALGGSSGRCSAIAESASGIRSTRRTLAKLAAMSFMTSRG